MADFFDFDQPVDRSHSSSLRWGKYRGTDVIPLWVADMDFPSPPAVVEALYRRVEHGIFGYTLPPEELLQVVCEHLQQAYQWRIEPDWLVWLPGLVSGLNVTCRAVGTDGDRVLTTTPIYPPFLTAPKNMHRLVDTAPMERQDGRWRIRMETLERACSEKTRLFLLCNPHNPTGRVFTRDELREIAAFCTDHDLVICSDEIHCGLVLEPGAQHLPAASLSEEVAQRCITLMAPSKTYNLPGLGCSFAIIANPRLRARFLQAMEGIVPHVNLFGYEAALAAYRDGEPWRRALCAYLRDNRDLVERRIEAMPGLTVAHVEATYLAWIDATELDAENPHAFFEAAGVGLSDGKDFGAKGFVRLNFGCRRALLETALTRMEQAIRILPR